MGAQGVGLRSADLKPLDEFGLDLAGPATKDLPDAPGGA
jgi:hypothetical protein